MNRASRSTPAGGARTPELEPSPGLSTFHADRRGVYLPRWALLALFCLLSPSRVEAHSIGQSYIFLDVDRAAITGRVETTLIDLDAALGLDQDHDGKVSSAEFEAKVDAARKYIAGRLKFTADGSPYPLRLTEHSLVSLPIGEFVQFHFALDGVTEISPLLEVEASFYFDINPRHLVLLVVERNDLTGSTNNTEAVSLIFDEDSSRRTLDLMASPGFSEFLLFVWQGIWHIWIGIDHILFLLALILPGVLTRQGNRWTPVTSFRPAAMHVVKVVTLFTVAHSITLSLAALQVIELPSRLVESIIAASVILAALNCIRPIFGGEIGWIVFGFGLFHGLGFAGVLGHLVSRESSLFDTLVGFNVGVEIGQVAVILVAFPILYAFRETSFYRRIFLPSAASLIALIALLWLVERAFDVELFFL